MLRQKYARELMEQHWKKIKVQYTQNSTHTVYYITHVHTIIQSDIVTEARSKAPAYREKTALPL